MTDILEALDAIRERYNEATHELVRGQYRRGEFFRALDTVENALREAERQRDEYRDMFESAEAALRATGTSDRFN